MTGPARVRVRVLGPVTVSLTGDAPTDALVTQPRQVALLAYLVLARPRGLHARDTIVALLWPEHDEARARQALRNALHGLRRILGPDIIESAGDQLVGVRANRVECDALDVEAMQSVPAATMAGAHEGIKPFAGFHVARAPAFNAWLDAERARLTALVSGRLAASVADETMRGTAAPKRPSPHITDRSPHDQDAYALYVRGNYMFLQAGHNGRFEDLDRSRECFERALAIDPAYALAIAGLSNYYAVAGARGVISPFRTAFARAIELSHQALAIDATLAVPHVHFGVSALYLDDDLALAIREFTAATTLDPKYAEGHRFLGISLGLAGQAQRGLTSLEKAAQLEPDVAMYSSSLAAAFVAQGDDLRAEQLLRDALRIDLGFGAARERLLRLLERQHRFADAVAERMRLPAMRDAQQFADAWRADGDDGYRRERIAELRRLVDMLEAKIMEGAAVSAGDHFHPPVLRLALAYAELGDSRKARAWKLQGCAARPGLTPWFAAEPLLRDLHER
jgi:tetratricopeptide (TPR) repeat protein